jgi:hypothetical protein
MRGEMEDPLVIEIAHALATANKRACELGVDPAQCQIVIEGGPPWQISYAPRDYINQRGGDLLVEVDGGVATRVVRGQ